MAPLLDKLHSVAVLTRAGMLDFGHPVRLLRGSRAVRHLGPIAGAVSMSAQRCPNDIALTDEKVSWTYRHLDEHSNALARGLARRGLRAGSVIGVLCRDHAYAVAVMVAAGKLGARLVLLNTGFAAPQLLDVMRRENVDAVVADEEFAELLDAVTEPRFFAWTDTPHPKLPTLENLAADESVEPLSLPAQQGGMVLLTGGTTGTPKGAPRSVGSPLVAAQFVERIPQRRGDVVFIAAPLFHGTGLSQFIVALCLGSRVILRRRFDAAATLTSIQEHQVTVLILVPTMLSRLLNTDAETLAATATSSLRIILSAGAPLTTELGNRAVARFGPVLHNFYGCTEVALATVATPQDWAEAPGTVGRPPRGVRVELLDEDGTVITSPSRKGRIFVDNGLKFSGYSGGGSKPTVGDLMGTGDTGHWDDQGRLFIDGRDDDMFTSGGENVFPAEIENLIATMPGVSEVASLPVPDDEFGMRLRVFVVPDGTQAVLDEEAVKGFVRSNLARYKVPRDVVFVEAIPVTAAGKVSRERLRQVAQR